MTLTAVVYGNVRVNVRHTVRCNAPAAMSANVRGHVRSKFHGNPRQYPPKCRWKCPYRSRFRTNNNIPPHVYGVHSSAMHRLCETKIKDPQSGTTTCDLNSCITHTYVTFLYRVSSKRFHLRRVSVTVRVALGLGFSQDIVADNRGECR